VNSYTIKIKGKWEKFYEIIGTITTVVGVFLVSEGYYVEGFLINGFSDIVWAWWAYLKKANYLIALQVLLFIIMMNGVYNNL
tara:strand:+ start:355 stop:600 length:246 start_codon:yes stop_codon:yes gene_type:complete